MSKLKFPLFAGFCNWCDKEMYEVSEYESDHFMNAHINCWYECMKKVKELDKQEG